MSLDILTIEDSDNVDILKKAAKDVQFPLSKENKTLIEEMKIKLKELNGSGLAAPQIGKPVRIIVFRISAYALTVRADAEEEVPLTVLINPSYIPIEEEGTYEDWEKCFSFKGLIGKIPRYNAIIYKGFTPGGEEVEEEARGYLARVLQHEIDHTQGYLITDRLVSNSLRQKSIDPKQKSHKNQDPDPIEDLSED